MSFQQAMNPADQADLGDSWYTGTNVAPTALLSPSRNFFSPTPIQRTELTILVTLAALSLAILALYALRNILLRALPRSLQPFAKDEGIVDEHDDLPPHNKQRRTVWTLLLGLVCFGGAVLSFLPVFFAESKQLGVMLEVVPWVVALLIWTLDQPTKAPRLLLLLFFLDVAAYVWRASVLFLNNRLLTLDPFRLAQAVLSVTAILSVINMPLRPASYPSSNIGSQKCPPTNTLRSPEDNLTLFQFFTMTWVYPLAKIARNRNIVVEDVWQLPYEYQHSRLYLAFRELKGKLLWRLGRANGLDLSIAIITSTAERVAEVSNIRLTSKLYQALDQQDIHTALFWCFAMLAVDGGRQLCKTTSMWYSRKAYERSRGETFIALFGKLLTRAVPGSDLTEKGGEEDEATTSKSIVAAFARLCGKRRKYAELEETKDDQPASNAKVVNLVRSDTYDISQRFWDACKVVSAPVKIGFTAYYLIDIMGWPSVIGFGFMIFVLAANSWLVKWSISMERQRTKHSDRRAQAASHFVEASRPLKLNSWTDSWKQRIFEFRGFEMRKRLSMSYLSALMNTISVAGAMLYPLASIGLYTVIAGHRLPNAVIWPSLQLFAQLEVSMKEMFDLVSALFKAKIPVNRVHKFMAEPDRDEEPGNATVEDIAFEDASFAWPATENTVLRNISLTFPAGLTVIKGPVGSGKSSLLLAALNEMELHEGNLMRPDVPIAYCQQLPWLQNKSIRDNIVFHERFDAKRYRDTLTACALGPDLGDFPDGDRTKLEEGGVGLSGGQKARVALARAVYSSARILILDDPLAALDHDTASLIVRRFLRGPLAKGRTIVMSTHRVELVLRVADQVVEINSGTAKILSQDEIKEELLHPHNTPSGHHDAEEEDHQQHAHQEYEVNFKEEPETDMSTKANKLVVFGRYMRAGGWHLWLLLAVFYCSSRLCDIGRARLLEDWGKDSASDVSSTVADSKYWFGLPDPDNNAKLRLVYLAVCSAGQVISFTIAQCLLARICYNAATGLFRDAIDRISAATVRWHDTTPTGQLKNRLINDMGMVDGGILTPLEGFLYNLITLVVCIVAIATHQPILLLLIGVMVLFFIYLFWIYIPASRCLRKMEMMYLTPIITNISTMQNGLVTIRALRVEGRFQDRHLEAVDDFQKQDHFYWCLQFWLDFRTNMSTAVMRAALVLFLIWWGTAASAIGFVLTQASVAMIQVTQLCEKFAQLQLDAVSLERIEDLSQIPAEDNGDDQPPEDWPTREDDVKFEDMSFQYDDDLPKVLKHVSFKIPGGSTCAVLGRTGSGKSTIANALLVTEKPATGTIKIGDYDLSKIDRKVLRDRLTVVQQDPSLFPGTLRENIDPTFRFTDDEVLKSVHSVMGPDWRLDSTIDAEGKNLSQGERQLVSLSRAIVRRSGLVILDEATASIDRETAGMVQKILRRELAGSTVITIAHRLEAVEDADWCLRLDLGTVVSCGPAKDLKGPAKGGDRQGG